MQLTVTADVRFRRFSWPISCIRRCSVISFVQASVSKTVLIGGAFIQGVSGTKGKFNSLYWRFLFIDFIYLKLLLYIVIPLRNNTVLV